MKTHRIGSDFRVQTYDKPSITRTLFKINNSSTFVTPAECKRLRDALIELHPLNEESRPLWEED